MKSEIVRTVFCEKCFKERHPAFGDRFVHLFKEGLGVLKLDWRPPPRNYGFTPHFITEYSEKDEDVIMTAFCLINNCGIDVEKNKDNENFKVYLRRPKIIRMKKTDWNALCSYFDEDYSLLNYDYEQS